MERLFLLALCGCTWVGSADYEARLPELDDDGDGVPAGRDCDDNDGTINPSINETWYDGVDQKCDGGDDFDQDGDGFVPDEYVGRQTAGVAGSGALPGGDCGDEDNLVSPIQPDTFYDGVDQDCDSADDYDQDLDGYVADEYVGLATQYADGTGQLAGGDCDDEAVGVNPDARDDPYDGIDTDCGGNDDFDADGDLYVSEEHYAEYTETLYVEPSGNLPNGDCDDADPTVNPAAVDAWYDGIDADCAEDDDYDQDADGWPSELGGGEDCDDEDSGAFPGGVETLGDRADSDCDGGVDSFDLEGVSGYVWSAPADPVFGASTDRVYLSVAARQVSTGTLVYYNSGVALFWEVDDIDDGVDGNAAWGGNDDPGAPTLSEGHGFSPGDTYVYGALGQDTGTERRFGLMRYAVSTGATRQATVDGTARWEPYEDVSLAVDGDGAMYAAGCETGDAVFHYVKLSSAGATAANVEVSDLAASECAIDIRSGEGHVYAVVDGDLVDLSFDTTSSDPSFTTTVLSALYSPLDLVVPQDADDLLIVFADAAGSLVILEGEGLDATSAASGLDPMSVSVAIDDAGTLYLAFADASGDVWLAYGTTASGFEYINLGVAFTAEDAAVWVTETHVLVAATGGNNLAVDVARR